MKHIFFAGIAAFFLLLSLSADSRAQAFLWVPLGQEGQHAGYQRVVGGKLNDGTPLIVCRSIVNQFKVPGKYYNRMCMTPWHGKEIQNGQNIEIFMAKAGYRWKPVHDLSHAQIEGAVLASSGSGQGNEYICRRVLQDGTHPGKYAIGNGNCYISWAGKEYHFTDGFDILFP